MISFLALCLCVCLSVLFYSNLFAFILFFFRFSFVFCNRGLEEKRIGVGKEVGSGQNWRRDK